MKKNIIILESRILVWLYKIMWTIVPILILRATMPLWLIEILDIITNTTDISKVKLSIMNNRVISFGRKTHRQLLRIAYRVV